MNENQPTNEPVKGNIRDYIDKNSSKIQKAEFDIVDSSSGISVPLFRPDREPKVIVTTQVHHRDNTGKLKSEVCRSVRLLESKDDPLQRTITVNENWQKLNLAWIEDVGCGYIFLRNNGGKPFNVMPNDEQIKETQSKIIELALSKVSTPIDNSNIAYIIWLIHPSESMQGKPNNNCDIYVRCQHGETSLTIFALPN